MASCGLFGPSSPSSSRRCGFWLRRGGCGGWVAVRRRSASVVSVACTEVVLKGGGFRHLWPAVVARGGVDLDWCFGVLALASFFRVASLAGCGGEGRRLLEVERRSGGMWRRLLSGCVVRRWRTWPSQLRWSGVGPRPGAAGARGASPADGLSPSQDPTRRSARRSWCLLRLINAFVQGVPPFPG